MVVAVAMGWVVLLVAIVIAGGHAWWLMVVVVVDGPIRNKLLIGGSTGLHVARIQSPRH